VSVATVPAHGRGPRRATAQHIRPPSLAQPCSVSARLRSPPLESKPIVRLSVAVDVAREMHRMHITARKSITRVEMQLPVSQPVLFAFTGSKILLCNQLFTNCRSMDGIGIGIGSPGIALTSSVYSFGCFFFPSPCRDGILLDIGGLKITQRSPATVARPCPGWLLELRRRA